MLAGIVGDVIGSVYEAHQWKKYDLELLQPLPINDHPDIKPLFENMKWVRKQYGWTDDTLCTLALYSAYLFKEDPVKSLQDFCNRYADENIGFGKAFKEWLTNPVPYESYGNGSVMRIGFIPYLNLSLNDKLGLGLQYTEISHNHADSFSAVSSFIILCDQLQKTKNKDCLKQFLQDYKFDKTVQSMHEENIFEINALQTLLQSVVAVYEAENMEQVLRNTFYIGGDSDTLACIACNIASHIYPLSKELWAIAETSLQPYPELDQLSNTFKKHFSEL